MKQKAPISDVSLRDMKRESRAVLSEQRREDVKT